MYHIDLQLAYQTEVQLPTEAQFKNWALAALKGRRDEAVLSIRLVGYEESASLNQQFRHRAGPTNILSFPIETDFALPLPLLGDLVICVPLVFAEAEQQAKTAELHWAHLVVHGTLHLLGYDHQTPTMAQAMESLEIAILADLNYPNPYGDDYIHD